MIRTSLHINLEDEADGNKRKTIPKETWRLVDKLWAKTKTRDLFTQPGKIKEVCTEDQIIFCV